MMQCGVRGEVSWFRWGIPKITDQSPITDFFPFISFTRTYFLIAIQNNYS